MTVPSLEKIFAGKGFAALPASPLQIAICRAADGRSLRGIISQDECEKHFGTRALLGVVPTIVVVVAGVRGGKSLLASCAAIRGALAADLSALRPFEVPRYSVVAPSLDNANATFAHLRGIITGSKLLSSLLIGEPTADTLRIRRPSDGRETELCVVSASRGGIKLRSRWLCGFCLEETGDLLSGEAGYAINGEDLLAAAEPRLLPGAQGWIIGSPKGPQGLLYREWQSGFGKPGRTLVVHGSTRALNPSFPQATIDAVRARNPDDAAQDHDAAFIDPSTAYLEKVSIEACARPGPLVLPPVEGRQHFTGGDAGTRGHRWTIIVLHAERDEQGRLQRIVVDLARYWKGSSSAPLSTRSVLREIGQIVSPYDGANAVRSDAWSVDAMRSDALDAGLMLLERRMDGEERAATWREIKTLMNAGRIELPNDPVLLADLAGVRKKNTPNGISIHLPQLADGSHCDFAPALAAAVGAAIRAGASSSAVVTARVFNGDRQRPARRVELAGPEETLTKRNTLDDLSWIEWAEPAPKPDETRAPGDPRPRPRLFPAGVVERRSGRKHIT